MQDLEQKIFCPKCGMENSENSYKCTRCMHVLHAPAYTSPPRPIVVSDDNTLGGLVPYKNKWGLLAYYLGLLSLLPLIGLPIGIAAVVFGIKGVALARRQPEVKGAIHAWVGILMGGFFTLMYGILAVLLIGSLFVGE